MNEAPRTKIENGEPRVWLWGAHIHGDFVDEATYEMKEEEKK